MSLTIFMVIDALRQTLPPIFPRKEIPKLLGNAISVGTIANLGKDGPPYIRQSKHSIYEKNTFLEWYERYLASKSKDAA